MRALQSFLKNEDIPLFPSLIEGVSAGFQNDVPPSGCFPVNDKPDSPSTPSSVHLANWSSADKEPQTTADLVEEEHKQGWVYRFNGSIDDAKEHFSHPAVGQVGVAFSSTRPPRLVVDSSVCRVNDRCKLPERTTLPSAKDVIRCFPLRNNPHDLAGFSLDITSLSRSKLQINGFLVFDSMTHYTFTEFARLDRRSVLSGGRGWILRFFHHAVWIQHAAWLYVDDYLWLQQRDILPLVATFLALLCRILNIPISWRKTELDVSIHWIGWSFHFSAGHIEIPKDKRDKFLRNLQQLLNYSRTPRTYLENHWVDYVDHPTVPSHEILGSLYNDLYSIPCTNYSIDPGSWPQLPECLNDQLQFIRQPSSTAIPIGSTLVSVTHQTVTSKQDLQNLRVSNRRIWMRIRDPSSDKRIFDNQLHTYLESLYSLTGTLFTSGSSPTQTFLGRAGGCRCICKCRHMWYWRLYSNIIKSMRLVFRKIFQTKFCQS